MSRKDRTPSVTPSSNGPTPSASTATLVSNPEELAEKELIEEYLAQHGLETSLNVFINQVVRDRPSDPYLVLAGLLQNRATSGNGIFSISAREVIDANGLPTLQASVHTSKGRFDGATSAATAAIYDTDEVTRFRGKGVRARDLALYVQHLLEGVDPCEQASCDEKVASMEEKIGRQACLALSIAICKAGAMHNDVPLFEYIATLADVPIESACIPVPIFSLLHGGTFGSNKMYIQEITAQPMGCLSFQEALRWGCELQLVLKDLLDAKGMGYSNRGVFGGYVPLVNTTDEALVLMAEAVKKLHETLQPTDMTIGVGVHVAAHAFATPSDGDCVYNLDKWIPGSKGLNKSGDDLLEITREWVRQHNLKSIVDPFDARDVKIAGALTRAENEVAGIGDTIGGDPTVKLQVVGHAMLRLGLETLHEERAVNTVLLHLSEFSSITAVLKAVTQARVLGLSIIVGCDAGTPDDTFVVDFAIGIGCGQVKFGGLLAADAVARYNRLAGFLEDPRAPPYSGATFRR
ncbi:Aste57867_24449 [Aphanomyces stellatus]|uniref:phosphopyruvate hydratase n=1 Tax=Aphanomyces stellatus TaxID=120398 RepID=A0A485LS16_9STRA|nr:hypothetical protein As57867_024373 [Aphanomyces stellatus]VFU01089.1 Aste57867_24449 [Aphanomyces stellatus]